MNSNYKIIKNVKDNKIYRDSFNALAAQTFGLNFEDWYQNGYWKENYIPYSIWTESAGAIVANVSVNPMTFNRNGQILHLIQLGTVMTAPEYRGQGLSRILMEEIAKDYDGTVDGIFLFGNDSVLEFYPRFGFRAVKEVQYSRVLTAHNTVQTALSSDTHIPASDGLCSAPAVSEPLCSGLRPDIPAPGFFAKQIPMPAGTEEAASAKENASANAAQPSNLRPADHPYTQLEKAVRNSCPNSSFEMINNPELVLFYASKFMQESFYYLACRDAWIAADVESDTLYLHNIFSPAPVDPLFIARAFGPDIHKVVLGFVPLSTKGWNAEPFFEEDCTLFVKGKAFENWEAAPMHFSPLSHT